MQNLLPFHRHVRQKCSIRHLVDNSKGSHTVGSFFMLFSSASLLYEARHPGFPTIRLLTWFSMFKCFQSFYFVFLNIETVVVLLCATLKLTVRGGGIELKSINKWTNKEFNIWFNPIAFCFHWGGGVLQRLLGKSWGIYTYINGNMDKVELLEWICLGIRGATLLYLSPWIGCFTLS